MCICDNSIYFFILTIFQPQLNLFSDCKDTQYLNGNYILSKNGGAAKIVCGCSAAILEKCPVVSSGMPRDSFF